MKRIVLLSDTHGYFDERCYNYFEKCDEIWHAGDFGTIEVSDKLEAFKPLKGVYGNIDGDVLRRVHTLDQKFECENIRVWMTHIGGYPGKYEPRVRDIISSDSPDLFICGHSHILKITKDLKLNNMLCMNPGAAGKSGFHKVRTMIRFAIDGNHIHDVEVIELGNK